jgi:hypothetical protein
VARNEVAKETAISTLNGTATSNVVAKGTVIVYKAANVE